MSDLTTIMAPGQSVHVRNGEHGWETPRARVVKTVTPKQVRFVDKAYPQFINADRADSAVFTSLKAYYAYARLSTEVELGSLRATIKEKEGLLGGLAELEAQHS